MAALIFRRFWANNALQHVAVLGDISLDAEMRGRGLGRSLLKFVAEDLDRNHPDTLAFVIPTEAAQRSLTSVGWTVGRRLKPYVFMLNPEEKLRRYLVSPWLAREIAGQAGKLMASVVRLHRKQGYSLHMVGELDDSFDTIWQRFDKTQFILSDRGIGALRWRYANHPQHEFKFASLDRHGQLAGYLIYQLSDVNRECSIYDLILLEQEDLGCMLALLVLHYADQGGIDTIRLLLNDDHPYSRQLWKLGFVARDHSGVFQLYGRTAQTRLGESRWFLTYGDKDI